MGIRQVLKRDGSMHLEMESGSQFAGTRFDLTTGETSMVMHGPFGMDTVYGRDGIAHEQTIGNMRIRRPDGGFDWVM